MRDENRYQGQGHYHTSFTFYSYLRTWAPAIVMATQGVYKFIDLLAWGGGGFQKLLETNSIQRVLTSILIVNYILIPVWVYVY